MPDWQERLLSLARGALDWAARAGKSLREFDYLAVLDRIARTADWRRGPVRRNALVFLASVAIHLVVFFIAASEFTFYRLPEPSQPAVEVEIVPQTPPPIVPPPPILKPPIEPKETPAAQAAPPPTPQQPKPKPPTPVPTRPAPPAQSASAPVQAPRPPTPSPLPKPSPAPSPAPQPTPAPAPQPGPPRVVSAPPAPVQTRAPAPAPHIVLHRNKDQGAPLAPPVMIPGAVFAPPQQPPGQTTGPTAGGNSGGGGGGGPQGFPGGRLPGFGSTLRGGLLGCANAAALHLTAAEQAKCNENFGAGTHQGPQFGAFGVARRGELDSERAAETAAQKYRDSTPAASDVHPENAQPRQGQSPAKPQP